MMVWYVFFPCRVEWLVDSRLKKRTFLEEALKFKGIIIVEVEKVQRCV